MKKSNRKNKKFMVSVKGKWIHFGDKRYEDYTQHKDKDRRKRYLARATKIRDKNGRLTKDNPMSPNYWSLRKLWSYRK